MAQWPDLACRGHIAIVNVIVFTVLLNVEEILFFGTYPLTNFRTVDFLQNLSLGQFNLLFGKHLSGSTNNK